VLVATVLLVAANLRPAITSVGPVLQLVEADTGLGPGALGLLGAVPLLTLGIVSPFAHRVASRIGTERTVLVALGVLTAGTLLRSAPGGTAQLWAGTVLLGSAIAIGNVLIPAVVKRDFPHRVPILTGLYSAVMGGFAGIGSGLAVPLAGIGGWRLSLGVWAAWALLAALAWLARLRAGQPEVPATDREAAAARTGASGMALPRPEPPERQAASAQVRPGRSASMWRSGLAWQVAVFFGLQSASFYTLTTWLPSIEASLGVTPAVAGWHLFLFQFLGIFGGLVVGPVMHRQHDQRPAAIGVTVLMFVAMIGLLVAPGWLLVWAITAGVSTGSSIAVALTLVSVRAKDPESAGQLSGMAQGVGYLIAAAGPAVAGLLHEVSGAWTLPIVAVLVIATVQFLFAALAGRDRFTH
jgi:CP family cyanate transporter-like MFS transporter